MIKIYKKEHIEAMEELISIFNAAQNNYFTEQNKSFKKGFIYGKNCLKTHLLSCKECLKRNNEHKN